MTYNNPGARRQPTPPRRKVPIVIPIACWTFATVIAAIWGGGNISSVLAGHGFAGFPGFYSWLEILAWAWNHPGDPAGGWPASSPRPGGPWLTYGAMIVCVGAVIFVGYTIQLRMVERVSEWRSEADGFAAGRSLERLNMTGTPALEQARRISPSLKNIPVHEIDPAKALVTLGRTSYGRHTPVQLQMDESVIIFGPTGSGKTWRVAVMRILDAPGPVAHATTKTNSVRATIGERKQVGEVFVFDPEDITRWPDKMRFSMLADCEDPEVALRRASAMVSARPMGGTKDANYWESKAVVLIRCYLHAARLSGGTQHDIRLWLSSRNADRPLDVLRNENPEWGAELEQILRSKADSSDDMIGAAASLFDPLASPKLARALATPPEQSVNLGDILDSSNSTIYLLSSGRAGSTAPWVSVVANELHHLAAERSLSKPGERHDPVLRMVLDEVNNVAPMPDLASRLTDSRDRGISIWAFVHSAQQNIDRWGPTAGPRLTWESPCAVVLPGLKDLDYLNTLSDLCGTRDVWIRDPYSGPDGRPILRTERVMPADSIRTMPSDEALVVVRNQDPVLVHMPTIFNDAEAMERVTKSRDYFDKMVGNERAAVVFEA